MSDPGQDKEDSAVGQQGRAKGVTAGRAQRLRRIRFSRLAARANDPRSAESSSRPGREQPASTESSTPLEGQRPLAAEGAEPPTPTSGPGASSAGSEAQPVPSSLDGLHPSEGVAQIDVSQPAQAVASSTPDGYSTPPTAEAPAGGGVAPPTAHTPSSATDELWAPIVSAMEGLGHDEQVSGLLSRAAAAVERSARHRSRLEAQLSELVEALESAARFAEL